MKSNVTLHLEEGATLKFSTDQKLYFPGVITRWEGLDCYNARPLIYAYGESNIAITGKGTIDGQGSNEPGGQCVVLHTTDGKKACTVKN